MPTALGRFPLYGTPFFDVITSSSTGAATDADFPPQFDLFEEDNDTPLLGTISLVKRTNKTGDYRGRFFINPTIGFEIGKFYNVVVSGTVSSVGGKIVPLMFQVTPQENIPGFTPVNVSYLSDAAIQQSGGYQKISEGTGTGQLDLTAGRPGIDWAKISNKTSGVELPNTLIGTVSSLGHPARAQVNLEADAALVDINLDQLVKIAVPSSFAASVHLSSILGQMADAGSATFNRTTDSLEAIRDRGDAAWGAGGSGSDLFGTLSAIKLKTDNLPVDPADASDIATSFTVEATARNVMYGTLSAIKVKTDLLPNDPADASDIAASFASEATSLNALYGTLSAIKLKTDNLPVDPADASDLAASFSSTKGSIDQISARLPVALVGGLMRSDVVAISTDTVAADNLEAAFDGTGGVAITATFAGELTGQVGSLGQVAKAEVNAEADTALIDINLDHLIKSAVDTDFPTTVHLSSVLGQMADDGTTATFDRTTDSLEAIRNRGDTAWGAGGAGSDLFGTLSAIKLKTDNLPIDPADASDIATSFSTTQGTLTQISSRIPSALTAAGHVKSDILAISSDVIAADNLEAAFDGTGNVSITATFAGALTGQIGSLGQVAKAEVNAEADAALVDINLDHLVKSAVDTDFPTTVHLNSILGQMADDGSVATFDRTTDSLEAIRDRGDAAWTTGGAASSSDLFGTLAIIKNKTDNLPTDPADASDIAASFASEATSRNVLYGTLSAIKVKTDNLPIDPADASDIAASFGIVQSSVNTMYGTLSGIKTRTDNLPTDPADASDITASFSTVNATLSTISGFLDTEVAAILADTTQIKADLPQKITKNVAFANFPFKMVLSSDHYTAATGVTITATRSLDGAAFAACANTATEIGGGVYKINLAATDLNADAVVLRFTATACDTREVALVLQPT